MASQIRFEPSGVDGLVASGTTIAAAAERLGVAVEMRCGGVGECTTCAIRAVHEPFALSPLTDAERTMLSEADVASGIRLGCQARTGDSDCTIHVLDAAERPPMPAAAANEAPCAEGADSREGTAKGSIWRDFDWMWMSSWGKGSGEGASSEASATQEPTQGEPLPHVDADDVRRRILDAFNELPAGDRLATALELNMKAATDFFGAVFEGPFRAGEEAIESLLKQAATVVRDAKQRDAEKSGTAETPAPPDAPNDDQEADRP
jgi:2Fe-2S ferredoxin